MATVPQEKDRTAAEMPAVRNKVIGDFLFLLLSPFLLLSHFLPSQVHFLPSQVLL